MARVGEWLLPPLTYEWQPRSPLGLVPNHINQSGDRLPITPFPSFPSPRRSLITLNLIMS